MKRIWLATLLMGILFGGTPCLAKAEMESFNLQGIIDRAEPGETIIVPPGNYEGPLIISKTLRLEAEHEGSVTLLNSGKGAALQIESDHVTVTGLEIMDELVKEKPSVLVTGDGVLLERLHIHTGSYGIKMQNADDGDVRNNTIEWSSLESRQAIKMADKGNGIDLYNAHRNRITENIIKRVHDGIYLENSDENTIIGNRIENSRYGVHCMYTKGTVIRENIGQMNITGAMVMTVRDVEVVNNTFMKQSENVNSQGILLYDAHFTTVRNNRLEGNRVGLYIEQSANNRIENNGVTDNFIGIQLLESIQNTIRGNRFSGNVSDALAKNSTGNDITGNFWDSFRGIDADGDGRSDIVYAINPFFQGLIQKRPAFQLFFQSPGMVFLESLYQSERSKWTKDISPLMAPPASTRLYEQSASGIKTGLIGILLLGSTCIILLLTRRRKI
ncbi:right-handed parallel beta-helix repeat-containing protein [Paenibacillus baekrokdamisoli]|nr:right-handed parallel beta-helix repeat-containing protein [Paenibacillus baekrokdamisoli]